MDNQNKNKKKRVDLASLYPVPKSYDELQQRHETIEAKRLQRQPKHEPFWTSISLSLSVLILLVGGSNISPLLYGETNHGRVMSLVFLLFLIGLAWVGFTGWQVKRLSNFFGRKSYSATPFYATYCISALALLPMAYAFLVPMMSIVWVSLILALINIALINLLVSVVVAKSLKNSYKIGILSAIVVASVVAAIVAVVI